LTFSYVIIIDDIDLCEHNDHVNGIFRTGPRVTHVARAGYLVPKSTMLVTHENKQSMFEFIVHLVQWLRETAHTNFII